MEEWGSVMTSNIFSNGAARRVELLADVQRRLASSSESLEQVLPHSSTFTPLESFRSLAGAILRDHDAALCVPSRGCRDGAPGATPVPGSRCEWAQRVGWHPAALAVPIWAPEGAGAEHARNRAHLCDAWVRP